MSAASGGSTLAAHDIAEYLRDRGLLDGDALVSATELTGGVSASVFLVGTNTRRLVVKQARERLLVAAEWTADPRRAQTEASALAKLGLFTPDAVPRVLDSDPANFALTMTAAPRDWVPWKQLLLTASGQGEFARIGETSAGLGRILGTWHAKTWGDPRIRDQFDDDEAFAELRVRPYFESLLGVHPAVTDSLSRVIDELTVRRDCLVHGDFSPKNILVGADGLWVLDFEVARVGAAVFDVAFMMTHLMLKAVHRPEIATVLRHAGERFIGEYTRVLGRKTRLDTLASHVAALLLARVDGQSPAEYLTTGEREGVRRIALQALGDQTLNNANRVVNEPTPDELWSSVLAANHSIRTGDIRDKEEE